MLQSLSPRPAASQKVAESTSKVGKRVVAIADPLQKGWATIGFILAQSYGGFGAGRIELPRSQRPQLFNSPLFMSSRPSSSPHSRISLHRYSSAVRPLRICVSCYSVNGTTFRFSRGISMNRGLVRAAMVRARAMRSLINNGPTVALIRGHISSRQREAPTGVMTRGSSGPCGDL